MNKLKLIWPIWKYYVAFAFENYETALKENYFIYNKVWEICEIKNRSLTVGGEKILEKLIEDAQHLRWKIQLNNREEKNACKKTNYS